MHVCIMDIGLQQVSCPSDYFPAFQNQAGTREEMTTHLHISYPSWSTSNERELSESEVPYIFCAVPGLPLPHRLLTD